MTSFSSPQLSTSLDFNSEDIDIGGEFQKRKQRRERSFFGSGGRGNSDVDDYDSTVDSSSSSYSDSSFSDDPPALSSESALFLRIFAAADYYSLDAELMEHVPPVLVDVILDPFLGNVFPRSLVPTAGWILVVAAVALFVGWYVTGYFQQAVLVAEMGMAGGNGVSSRGSRGDIQVDSRKDK